MTAELQAEEVVAEPGGANSQTLLNQLREITGIQDSSFLHEALKSSNGDLVQAVCLLTEEGVKEPSLQEEATEPSDSEGSALGKQSRSSVIDLTNDKEALQAAIALSLQDTLNPQDGRKTSCSRANENDHGESRNCSKRKRCEVWRDHPNPNEWRRVDNWPVGMKNIGNTCWFSAVIQSLFQLPVFRKLVLGFRLPQSVLENCRSHNEKRNIAFMVELQSLFALMVGSKCKFVDPSAALELLKDAFVSVEAQQQDVSEFTHKLLDWLEDAFQLAVNVKDKSENPMVQLFYGSFLTEGIREGKTFSNIEPFGQYPLQVNGYRNLGECLEGAMLEGEVDSSQSDQPVKYVQERWFTKLPPVLTFELSRFEFNQTLGQPEKIHNKLEFPQIIYMDRYLYKNRVLVREKREEIRRLKGRVMFLQQKLERYLKYGSGQHQYPLPDMLQCVLEFARTSPTRVCSTPDPLPPFFPSANGSVPSLPSTETNSSSEAAPSEVTEDTVFQPVTPLPESQPQHHLPHHPCGISGAEVQTLGYPAPRTITKEELQNLETCLQRWRTEVEHDIQDLKNNIEETNKFIEQMYTDPELGQVPYRLHAVLVHEGQANAGHYWAYIYSHTRRIWLKYNDISVSESSWEELERDSFGGMKNASAYCLMYINEQLSDLVSETTDGETRHMSSDLCDLPPVLKRSVMEDNQRFEQEVEEWEEQQTRKIPQMTPAAVSESEDLSSVPSEEPSCSTCHQERSPSTDHAIFTKEQTAQAIANTADLFEKNGVEAALKEAFREEYSRLHLLAEEDPTPHNDPRLQHVLIYLFQNAAPERVIERSLLEQFADRNLSYDERSIGIMKVAREKLKEIGPEDMDMDEYKKWHEDYSLFRKVSVYLLTGLELYQNGKCQEALTYLVYAYQSNTVLLQQGQNRGVEQSLIALYRRKCLVELNDAAASLFESGHEDQVSEAVGIMNELIIPSMQLIVNGELSKEDLDAIEVVRNHWCSYLGHNIDENFQMKLGEFLPRLLDCSAEVIVLKEPPKIRPNSPYDLCSRFAAVMESIHGNSTVTVA